VPGFEAAAWFGIYVPAATPRALVESLNRGIVAGLRAVQTERFLLAQGLQARYPSAAEFSELMRTEAKKWTAVLDGLSPPY
jgi:tripartite-type tricarboxylate transporter receptor subunit TctC